MHIITWTDKLGADQITRLPPTRLKGVFWLIKVLRHASIDYTHMFEE